ncbi:MAG: hypothetical protein IMW99_10285, partial [Firmicutes bacterium]|nr:hypothetical protein [Bacillota bacterium]
MSRPRVGPQARLSRLRTTWMRLAALSILFWLAAGGMGWDRSRAEPGEPAPPGVQAAPLKISGESTWSLRLGWGDPETLAALGLAAGSPVFSQSLSLDLEGEVAPGMALSAHLDNGNSGNLQLASVAARIPWGRLSLGKITVQPRNSLLAYNSAIMGASYAGDVQTPLGPWQVWASAGRVLGVPASRTFQGNSAEESVVFAPDGPYVPTWQTEGS